MMPHSEKAPNTNETAESWIGLLATHEGWLRQVIRARTGELQTVDDIFQQLALTAVERKQSLRDPARAAPWLHRIAVVLSARYCRSAGRERRRLETLATNAESKPDCDDTLRILMHRERIEMVQMATQTLAPSDREILCLKYEAGLSYAELSQRLGISEKAIDRRLARARQKLRHKLKTFGIQSNEQ
jgi:RNA polymerase sigma factor (sigma-70 family)